MGSKQGPFQFGEWAVEPELGRIRSATDTVRLEPKAIAVLAHLLEHAGQLVERQALIDVVWNGRIVEPGALSRNIALIRNALGDDARRPKYIETIPKRGYRTVAPVTSAAAGAPRIAVVPLENLSADPDFAFLAAAISEDVTALLGQLHPEQHAYALHHADRARSGEYVLTGSVRKAADRVRVAVRLSDPATRANIWSERYDRDFADLFALQDELVGDIVHAVGWATWRSVDTRLRHERPEHLDVWAKLHQSLMTHFDRIADAEKKIRLVEDALRIDGGYAYAHSTMAWTLIGMLHVGLSTDEAHDRQRALDHAATALSLAPDDARVINQCVLVHRTIGDLELALQLGERVVNLPGADPHDYWGVLIALGRAREVVLAARAHWRNSIIHQHSYVSVACSVEGLHEEALETALREAANFPKSLGAWICLANAQGRLAHFGDAEITMQRIRARSPNWTVNRFEDAMRFAWRGESRLVDAATEGLRMIVRDSRKTART